MTARLSEMTARAEDISEWCRPPRWRVFSYRHWKKHQQPVDVLWAMESGLRGQYALLRRYGVALPNWQTGRADAQEILDQTERLER